MKVLNIFPKMLQITKKQSAQKVAEKEAARRYKAVLMWVNSQ